MAQDFVPPTAPTLGNPVAGSERFAARAPRMAGSVVQARDYLGRLLVPHRLALHGDGRMLHLHHAVARLDRMKLHFIDYRSQAERVEVQAPRLGRNFHFKVPLSGRAEISQDRQPAVRIRPGMLFVALPERPLVSVMSRDYRQLMLEVPEEVLLATLHTTRPGAQGGALAAACAGPVRGALRFDLSEIHSTPAPRLLLSTLGTICDALEAGDGVIARPAVQHAFQETLSTLLLALPNNLAGDLARNGGPEPAPHYIRRAETYLRAHLTDEVGIDDLVRVAGVSRRSLHAGFRRFRATTPLGLFKSLRLDAARQALLQAGEEPVTVTDVATTYGFYHLGKFARDFRQTFGERPSDLLRAARNWPDDR